MLHCTVTNSVLPHGQEKSGKTKKNDISQVKQWVFEKSLEKIKKKSDFVSSNLLNFLYLKAFK